MWKKIPKSLESYQYAAFSEFSLISESLSSINVGEDYSSLVCPELAKEFLKEAVNQDHNQYSRPLGQIVLVEEIARVYSQKHNRSIDPNSEVIVTIGATEACRIAITSSVDPGDEVVIIDPAYPSYEPQVSLVRGVPIRVCLDPPVDSFSSWSLNFEKLETAFTERTRVFIFNSPNNPTGKVYTNEELEKIAEILKKWPNVAIIADEVCENVVFDNREHFSLCDFGDLWERTVTINSAGKTFAVSGWKIGWAVGGPHVIRKMLGAKYWTSFSTNTPCQIAIAKFMKKADEPYEQSKNFYEWFRKECSMKRDVLFEILLNTNELPIKPLIVEGGFFLCAQIINSDLIPEKYLEGNSLDFAFCRWMAETFKIISIPCSIFFSEENKHIGQQFVRFTLSKNLSEYEEIRKILNK